MKRRGFLKRLAVLPLAMKIALTEPVFSAPLTYEQLDSIHAWIVDECNKAWDEWCREAYMKMFGDGIYDRRS